MPTRKPKDKLSKSDKRMLKRMDKDIKTYAKIDSLKGKTKKTRRKRIVKKVSPTTGNKIKIKLKRGGGIKKTVTRKAGTVRNMRLKRRVVKKRLADNGIFSRISIKPGKKRKVHQMLLMRFNLFLNEI